MFLKDRGVQALVLTNVVGNILRLLSNLLLARMLSPEAFAITGLASTVVFAFYMISDGGFRAFILRRKDGEDGKVLNTLWTVILIRNILLSIAIYLSSEAIAVFFGVPELEQVLKFLVIFFIVDGLTPISYFVAERHNKIATVLYIKFFCSVVTTIFSVVGVFYLRSYWPIIYSMLLNAVLATLLGYVILGKKGSKFGIDKAILVEFFGWVKYIIPSSVLTLIIMQLDKLILGRTLSVSELGLYYVAFNFSSAASTFVIQYARSVLEPRMSIVYRSSKSDYLSAYYKSKTPLSIAIAFLLASLSGFSFVFFDLLYSNEYIDASRYLSILLITPIFALITYPAEFTLIFYGKVKMTLIANIIRFLWFISAAFFGYYVFGVFGVLAAIGLMELCPTIYMLYKMKEIRVLSWTKELFILLSACVGFFVGYTLTNLYKSIEWS